MLYSSRLLRCVFATLILFALSACGGGGGGGDDGSDSNDGGSGSASSAQQLQADAGNDRDVVTGTTVTLDGSRSSTAADRQLVYAWRLASRPSGSSARLESADTATPRFTADSDGDYVAELSVSAGDDQSETDRVTITATRGNTRPEANAGADQNVKTGDAVTLDGSASDDADGDTLTYAWSLTARPDASQTRLRESDTRTPSFSPDQAGRYVVSLVTNDGTVASEADEVIITAAQANSAPVANAGDDQNVSVGESAQLDGSASSDADGDALGYRWRIVSQPQGSTAALASPNEDAPSITTDALGDYVIELVVDDGQAESDGDRVVVNAGPVLALFAYEPEVETFVRAPNQVLTQVDGKQDADDQPVEDQQLGRFIFQAVGQDFTIENVATEITQTPDGRTLTPYFEDFDNGVIPMGRSIEFSTNAASISGNGEYRFAFTFTVAETGERYRLAYRLILE